MVALSQMPTFLDVGYIVTPSEVICENRGILVVTRDEKTAPPIIALTSKWTLYASKGTLYASKGTLYAG